MYVCIYVCMYVGCLGVVGCGRATFRVFMYVWYVCMYVFMYYIRTQPRHELDYVS